MADAPADSTPFRPGLELLLAFHGPGACVSEEVIER